MVRDKVGMELLAKYINCTREGKYIMNCLLEIC
jgi:hypothetical protein